MYEIVGNMAGDGHAKNKINAQSQLRVPNPNNQIMKGVMSVDEIPIKMQQTPTKLNRKQRKRAGVCSDGRKHNSADTYKSQDCKAIERRFYIYRKQN
jgi:hypothetical protein